MTTPDGPMATGGTEPTGRTWFAHELVRAHARDAGDALALVADGERLTWLDLDARCDAVAALVREAGVRRGERVAVVVDRVADAAPMLLGVLRAGAVAAPIAGSLRERERRAAIEVVAPALTILAASLAGRTAPAAADPAAGSATDPEAPAIIVMTSGTTGTPKGVILSHRAMAASADAWRAVLPPATGWAMPLGLAHVAGLGILWRAIADRVPVIALPPGDPAALLAALRGDGAPTHVSLVPGQLLRVLEASADAPAPAILRAVPLGGGAIPAALVDRALAAGWPVVPTYGLSEMGSGVTALATNEAREAPGTAGRPLPGVELEIREPDRDGIGEIVVRGPSRCSGHLGDACAAEPPTPATELCTGDLGRLDREGRLIVVDRRTDRIVRGGENIDPSEVEAVLARHPAVAEACVVGRQDERWGSVPVAAIVLRSAAGDRGVVEDPGDDALAAHARADLAGFKVPVAFARFDCLPRTSGGKLRRDVVRAFLGGARSGELARPGGDAIGWRLTGDGPAHILLLHGTVSTAAQLDRLAAALVATAAAEGNPVTVHAIDRRGSGTSTLARLRTLTAAEHTGDLVAYLDARGIDRALVVGHSLGGVIGLELAARHPDRVRGAAVYEPPYGLLAEGEWRPWFQRVARDTADAHARTGAPAAAEAFIRLVAGDAAWDRLPARARAYLEREGDGALVDTNLAGLDPDGLSNISAPVAILTGDASEPFYAPIADTLASRIPGARRIGLPGATHTTAISDPAPVAAAIRHLLEPTA